MILQQQDCHSALAVVTVMVAVAAAPRVANYSHKQQKTRAGSSGKEGRQLSALKQKMGGLFLLGLRLLCSPWASARLLSLNILGEPRLAAAGFFTSPFCSR